MGKLLSFMLLVTVLKCNGHLPNIGSLVPTAQKQVNGALGFASSILGGIASGVGLNLSGQIGFNSPKYPEHNNNDQYEDTPYNKPEETPDVHHRPQPSRPQQNYHNSHRPRPPNHNESGNYGYGNQEQHQGYPNHGYENYNHYGSYSENGPVRPGHPNQHYGGNFNNNGNYENQYPSNQNFEYNPGYNHGYNNNGKPHSDHQLSSGCNNNQFYQNGQKCPLHESSYNKPEYGNNNQYNENDQEYLNQIFGNPPHPNNGFNSHIQNPNKNGLNAGTKNPNNVGFTLGNENSFSKNPNNKPSKFPPNSFSPPFNLDKVTEEPKDDLPTFVPLSPVDTKRETATKKPVADDEEFDIDIRFKDQ